MKLLISFILVLSFSCHANDEQEAINKAGKALYKQLNLDNYVKSLDKKYTPQTVKQFGGWLLVVRQIAVEKQIKYTWTW